MLNLGSPDEFRGDPYGWLTNQMSHVLLGVLVAWIIGYTVAIAPAWLLIAVATLGAGAVEVIHLRKGGSIRDSLVDVGFVTLGAGWQACGGSWIAAVLIAAGLCFGTVRRDAEPADD
jgi:hypothetical protein